MSHIHKKTENDKISSNNSISRKQGLNTTTAPQKAIIASLNPTTEKKKQTKRKKTLRSGNSFIRPPKQNLLIMRYSEPVILRFD